MDRRLLVAAAIAIAAAIPARGVRAWTLRNPQVYFQAAGLQAALTDWDGYANAQTDQVNLPLLTPAVDSAFLMTVVRADGCAVGLYAGTESPQLVPIFPATASAGCFAFVRIEANGDLAVAHFDPSGNATGFERYVGVPGGGLGLYVEGPAGRMYSEDARNGAPQVLVYAGNGIRYGNWMECLEPLPYDPDAPGEFSRTLVEVMPQTGDPLPTPVRPRSWGSLKAAYR